MDVVAYVAGRGRDSREHEQFAANYVTEIEAEFQRRATGQQREQPEQDIETDRYGNEVIDMSGPVEPEPSREEPPPLEPDSYVSDRQPPPPVHDMDFGLGD